MGIDSTFLGMTSRGVALELKTPETKGNIRLYNVGDRNLILDEEIELLILDKMGEPTWCHSSTQHVIVIRPIKGNLLR